jgi:hypothetical protein
VFIAYCTPDVRFNLKQFLRLFGGKFPISPVGR